jgi:hypothetical protein
MSQYIIEDKDNGQTYEFPEGTTYQQVLDFFAKEKNAKKDESWLSKIANGTVVTDINNFGDFLEASGSSFINNTAAIPFKFLPKNKLGDWVIKQASDADSYFDSKYGDSSSAEGFKDALNDSVYLAAAPELDVMKLIEGVTDAMPDAVTKTLSFLSKKGSQGGLIGVASNQDRSKSEAQSFLSGAETNIGIAGTIKGAGKGFDYLSKEIPVWLGQTIKGSKLLKNIQKLKGGQGTGGEMLGSPYLKGFQTNILSKIPGSGQMAKFSKIVSKLRENGNKIYNHFLNGEDADFLLDENQKEIKEDLKEHQAEMQLMHGELDDKLEEKGLYPNFKHTDEAATELLNEYNEATELHAPALGNSDIHSILENYAGISGRLKKAKKEDDRPSLQKAANDLGLLLEKLGKPLNNLMGKNITPIVEKYSNTPEMVPLNPKIKYAKIAKNEIYKRAEEENSAYRKRVYQTLSKALDEDIEAVANKDPETKKLLKRNDNYYKKYLAKYYNPEVVGFTIGNEDPVKSFRAFIKTGKNENPAKMERYSKLLNGKQKKRVIAYSMRQSLDEDGNVNPQKLANYWKSMGKRTRDAFLTPSERSAFTTFYDRAKANQGAMLQDVQVATGFANTTANAIKMLAAVLAGSHLATIVPIIALARIARATLDNTDFLKFIAEQQMGGKAGESLSSKMETFSPVLTSQSNQ